MRSVLEGDRPVRTKSRTSRAHAAPEQIRERDVEAYLVKRVKAAGGTIRKARWLGVDGCPDRRILGKCWVELKRPKKGDLFIRQKKEHEVMRGAGEIVETAYTFGAVDLIMEKYFAFTS